MVPRAIGFKKGSGQVTIPRALFGLGKSVPTALDRAILDTHRILFQSLAQPVAPDIADICGNLLRISTHRYKTAF